MKISIKEAETRKKRILETGVQLLRKNSPDAVGIQEIADASGIPKGSFYNYFKSKDQFLLEALESYTLDAISWNKAVLRESGHGVTSLFNLYERKSKLEKSLFLEEISCFINVLSQYSSSSRHELRQKLKFSLETIAQAISEALPVPKSEELLQKIRFLESSWRGAMLLYRATGDEIYLDQFLTFFPKTILGD
ncbi:TetR/AcrR family transcriptional regulator [Leptospira adleri]|uniref:TetR/AcrR family transcriptional regulator n=1 Tax=Leptospira adleri TaxID=2023186 RepID=UPI0010847731|nr:TetR/AcrR family transcriptional regulator [Leptospira adleri]TGM58619.1 TetR/AcrR family transcriptional regulator [Leptospira adleri]